MGEAAQRKTNYIGGVNMAEWLGNMTVRLNQTKDTFPFKWVDARRYCEEGGFFGVR
jgi:hypothetical protein